MAQVCVKLKPYDDSDDTKDYFEQLQLFLAVNDVEDNKKVAHLLNEWVPKPMES